MKIFRTLLLFLFIVFSHSVFSQDANGDVKSNNPGTSRQQRKSQRKKWKTERKKEKIERKAKKNYQKKFQTEDTRKRMKKNYRKGMRTNQNKPDPFWKKWFGPKQRGGKK